MLAGRRHRGDHSGVCRGNHAPERQSQEAAIQFASTQVTDQRMADRIPGLRENRVTDMVGFLSPSSNIAGPLKMFSQPGPAIQCDVTESH